MAQQFNVNTASLQELKAQHYDLLVIREQVEASLKAVIKRIQEKTQQEQQYEKERQEKLLADKVVAPDVLKSDPILRKAEPQY